MLQGEGGAYSTRLIYLNIASEHKPRTADVFVRNSEGCSPVREPDFVTDPPKTDPSLQYILVRVNFGTIT